MLSMHHQIPKKNAPLLKPILPLIPVTPLPDDQNKDKFIAIDVKARVGAPETSATYKKFVRKFEEGTPHEWIKLLHSMREIWKQNSISGPVDRCLTVRALVRGELLTTFEATLDEKRMTEDGTMGSILMVHVEEALQAVAESVFPHRALETQKRWMNRAMKKPIGLSARKLMSAINRLNNSLPLFPGGSDSSKFSETDLIELAEWSVPEEWQTKFNLDGYIPTQHDKKRFIEACEALERHAAEPNVDAKPLSKWETKKLLKLQNRPTNTAKNDHARRESKYCTKCGPNRSHSTGQCWKNRGNKDGTLAQPHYINNPQKKFTSKNFRKEINLLSKTSSKRKVLDLYESAISRERARLSKSSKKTNKKNNKKTAESSSSEESVHVIEEPITKKRKKVTQSEEEKTPVTEKKKAKLLPQEEEEQAYQKQLWLKDHGDELLDTPQINSSETDN